MADDSVKIWTRGYHIDLEVNAGSMTRTGGPDRDMIQLWLDLTSGDAVEFSPNPDDSSPTWFSVVRKSGSDPALLDVQNGARMGKDTASFQTVNRLSESDLQLFTKTTNDI